jgi:hypothetical protein
VICGHAERWHAAGPCSHGMNPNGGGLDCFCGEYRDGHDKVKVDDEFAQTTLGGAPYGTIDVEAFVSDLGQRCSLYVAAQTGELGIEEGELVQLSSELMSAVVGVFAGEVPITAFRGVNLKPLPKGEPDAGE